MIYEIAPEEIPLFGEFDHNQLVLFVLEKKGAPIIGNAEKRALSPDYDWRMRHSAIPFDRTIIYEVNLKQ